MAIGTAIGLGTAAYQLWKGHQLSKQLGERQEYQTPEAIEEMVESARKGAAMTELAGQSKIEDKLRGATAGGVGAIKQLGGGGAGLGAAVDLFSREQGALTDLGIAADRQYEQRQAELRKNLQTLGAFQDKEFAYNVDQPYYEQKGEAADLTNAALMNLMGGAQSLEQGAVDRRALGIQEDYLQSLIDSGGTVPQAAPPGAPTAQGANTLFPGGSSTNPQDLLYILSLLAQGQQIPGGIGGTQGPGAQGPGLGTPQGIDLLRPQ